jgi:hypothetical protein
MVIPNIKNQVIGFCGYAGVGKDTAFKMMEQLFPKLRPHRVAFADELKRDTRGCEDALTAMGYDTTTPEGKEKFRDMWVWWSRVSKRFDPLIWLKRSSPAIHELLKRGWVFVTDVRYDFEVDTLRRERKATIFYIDRPGFGPANDEEEQSFQKIFERFPELVGARCGFRFVNDGTPEELGEKIKARICELFDIILMKNDCESCHSTVEVELRECAVCHKQICPDCLVLDFARAERRCKDCNNNLKE